MNSETKHDTFTRTRRTWLVLSTAGLLWVVLCVWTVKSIGFVADSQLPDKSEQMSLEQQAAEQAEMALRAEEDLKLQAQAAAAEQRQAAAMEAEEQAKLAAEREAEEQARLAAELEAEEQARLAAEREAEEQARIAAEREAEEQARLAAEREAEEQARLAAEREAEEQARLADSRAVQEEARRAAAAEASRIAAVARQLRQLRQYEQLRARETQVLDGLSERIRFEQGSATVSRDIERLLDDIFNPLYLYAELPVLVSIAGNEYDGEPSDALLSRDRGRAIASYLINRGLEKDRFRILIEAGENLTSGTHRVRVSAEEVR